MSLFPDRHLISTTPKELAQISPTLTDQQRSQLSTITEGYMREYRIIGYENTKAVLPVIKQCITDGLQAKYSRDVIISTDNLSVAFKTGYGQRKNLIGIMEEELGGLSGRMRFEGTLALPQDLVTSASQELASKISRPKLIKGQEVAVLSKVRRSILKEVVNYSRDRIEESIPGSKRVALTPQQEAGLMRHLVFSWAALGEPRLLLETEDFMTYRQAYLSEIINQGDVLWQQLAKLVGQDSPEAIAYLRDMSAQVTDLLASVPDKPTSGIDALTLASSIDTAFKALEKNFLVVNPFNKLPSLSENPLDIGRSIWDEDRSTMMKINGVVYRVPKVQTLILAAFLASGANPARAREYRTGADDVTSLITEIERVSLNDAKPGLEKEVEIAKEELRELEEALVQERVPQGMAIPRSTITRLVNIQRNLMLDEMQFIATLKANHSRLVASGIDLLKDYQDGEPLKSDRDFRRILTIYYSPGILRRAALYFTRERLEKRVRSIENMLVYRNFADAMASELFSNYRRRYFQESLDITFLDILSTRGKLWADQYRTPNPELSLGDLSLVWTSILTQEKTTVEAKATRAAYFRIYDTDKAKLDAERDRILANPSSLLGKRYAYILHLQDALRVGEMPHEERLYQDYLEKWKKGSEQKFVNAMREWTDRDSLGPTLEEALGKIQLTAAKDPEGVQTLLDRSQRAKGPLRITLAALAKLGPAQLLPDYPVTLEDVVHDSRKRDREDPFSYVKGSISERRLDSRLYILHNRFYQWLIANGIQMEKDAFDEVFKPQPMTELVYSGNAYHKLYEIEKELQDWYDRQRTRLSEQTKDRSFAFFSTPPGDLIKKARALIEHRERKLEGVKRAEARRLGSRLAPLQQLGLIRAEKLQTD